MIATVSTVHVCGEGVGLRDLYRRIRGRLRWLSVEAQMRVRLRALVDSEHAGDDAREGSGNRQWSLPATVGTGRRVGVGPHVLCPERARDGIHRPAQADAAPGEVHVANFEAVLGGEGAHGVDVGLIRAVGACELLAREPASLRRRSRRFGVDPVKRRGRAQVHGYLDFLAGFGVADARVCGHRLALAARDRNSICRCHHNLRWFSPLDEFENRATPDLTHGNAVDVPYGFAAGGVCDFCLLLGS
jgi:hypothetical protein